MNLPSLSVRYPSVLLVAILAITAWGVESLVTLPRQEDPALTWRLANVVTRLPGASPTRVESLITDVLERYIKDVDEVEHIYSISRAGVSQIQIELSDDVKVAEPVWQRVRQKLGQAAIELPEGVIGSDLDDEIMGTFALLIGFTGDSASYRQLKDHAKRLEDQLRYLSETASTSLVGVQREVIQVELDAAKLAAYDLSFDRVAAALRNRNTRSPSGRLRIEGAEMLIEASGEFEADAELAELVLLVTPGGETLRLGDVARIHRTTADPADPLARVNQRPAVVLGVRARPGVRIDQFGRRVGAILNQFDRTLPKDIQCTIFQDQPRYTRERLSGLSWTLLQSIALVFLATTLCMKWRPAVAVTTAMPLTGLIVLVLFSVLRIPIDQISVMAIIMALGMLVDNAVIVTEHIDRLVLDGVPIDRAAAEGPAELFIPLLVSTLTTVAAFVPMYLLPGGVGEFVRAIPVGVGLCLLVSLLVPMTATPLACVWLMPFPARRDRNAGENLSGVSGAHRFSILWRVFHSLLRRALARPTITVVLLVAIFSAPALLTLRLRRDFFSPVERDQFVVDVFAPQGSALGHTLQLVERAESLIAAQSEVVQVASFVGRSAPLVFYNLTSQEFYANHYAQMIVNVADRRETPRVAEKVQGLLRSQIAGADWCAHILEHGAPFMAPFEVRVSGPSIPTLRELGRRAAEILEYTPGVRNVRSNYGDDAIKLIARVNEPVAKHIGVDQLFVARELRSRLDGLIATHLQEGDEQIDISVRLARHARDDIADLTSVYFKPSPAAGLIPFSTVATLEPTWETTSIYRRDGQRTLTLLAYPQFGLTAAQVSKRFAPRLDWLAATVPQGYAIELGGENEQRHEAESNLLRGGVYAALLILLLLIGEFRSFWLTGLIVAAIPISIAGGIFGLWLTGWPLNFMAMMGMMMLMGYVVNDAVIIMDEYEKRRARGEPLADIVISGTLARARHVVITSVTTVAGFLPLALAKSLLWPPLAIVVIGGVCVETILVLVALPAAYSLLRRSR